MRVWCEGSSPPPSTTSTTTTTTATLDIAFFAAFFVAFLALPCPPFTLLRSVYTASTFSCRPRRNTFFLCPFPSIRPPFRNLFLNTPRVVYLVLSPPPPPPPPLSDICVTIHSIPSCSPFSSGGSFAEHCWICKKEARKNQEEGRRRRQCGAQCGCRCQGQLEGVKR